MLEALGAATRRCPLVQIVELEEPAPARDWISRQIANPADEVVLLTGDGLRKLADLAGTRRAAFLQALTRSHIVTRGPKPARALREAGLLQFTPAAAPTSQGVMETLLQHDLAGRRIGLQLYPGDGAQWLVRALTQQGALVDTVTPYRYANETESAGVAQMIRDLIAGHINMVAFTATPQVARLFAVAAEYQLEQPLRAALDHIPIAAVGPVMEEALAAHGLAASISPRGSFHLKPMVRAIAAAHARQVAA
jgi:uroporphyrinogen-III synthase